MDENLKKAEQALHKAQQDLWEAEEALHRAEEGEGAPSSSSGAVPAAPQAPPTETSPVVQEPEVQATHEEEASAQPAAPTVPAGSGGWRVEFDRDNCIGAGACVAANAGFWSIDEDGKATLKSAVYDDAKKRWVLRLEEGPELQKQRDAAGVCPVTVIHIIDPEGNQEI